MACWFRPVSLFKEFGAEFAVRLKRLLNFLIYGFLILYLLPVWRLFATMNESWGYLTELSIEFGHFNLTMQMLVSAVIAFTSHYKSPGFYRPSVMRRSFPQVHLTAVFEMQ